MALLAPVFLTELELNEFQAASHSVGAVCWEFRALEQTGYFDGAAETKPLLHVWSLAVEEQFYMIVPAALFSCLNGHGSRVRFWSASRFRLMSHSAAPSALCNFHLLPARAWELALGAVGALALIGPMTQRVCSYLVFPAIAALLYAHVFPFGGADPGLDAIVVCASTLVLIVGKSILLERTLVGRSLAKVGDFSYSISADWPIFAFLSSAWVGKIPRMPDLARMFVSLLVAYMLYRFLQKLIPRMQSISSRNLFWPLLPWPRCWF